MIAISVSKPCFYMQLVKQLSSSIKIHPGLTIKFSLLSNCQLTSEAHVQYKPVQQASVKRGRGQGGRETGRGIGKRGRAFALFTPPPLPFLCLPHRAYTVIMWVVIITGNINFHKSFQIFSKTYQKFNFHQNYQSIKTLVSEHHQQGIFVLVYHFAGKPVVALRNASFFLWLIFTP